MFLLFLLIFLLIFSACSKNDNYTGTNSAKTVKLWDYLSSDRDIYKEVNYIDNNTGEAFEEVMRGDRNVIYVSDKKIEIQYLDNNGNISGEEYIKLNDNNVTLTNNYGSNSVTPSGIFVNSINISFNSEVYVDSEIKYRVCK